MPGARRAARGARRSRSTPLSRSSRLIDVGDEIAVSIPAAKENAGYVEVNWIPDTDIVIKTGDLVTRQQHTITLDSGPDPAAELRSRYAD